MKENLMFASLGNGISVADQNREQHGDYAMVAHISEMREVKFYYNRLSEEAKKEIREYAETQNPRVSQTQDQPVFHCKPLKKTVEK